MMNTLNAQFSKIFIEDTHYGNWKIKSFSGEDKESVEHEAQEAKDRINPVHRPTLHEAEKFFGKWVVSLTYLGD